MIMQSASMRILALEAYYGGSHRAFLDGWIGGSVHEWTLLTLPPNKWKWRMRHAAITFAEQVGTRAAKGERWEAIFCSDMLNVAEFKGLAPAVVRDLPLVVYFHENQLTYPVRQESERDYHYVITNLTSAVAATQVWFNSAYHRESFLDALPPFLKRMPDFHPLAEVERIRAKSFVHPPGVESFPQRGPRLPGPLRILWAARWEHDKNPELFFAALRLLHERGVTFHFSVIGEQFRDAPPVFEQARQEFAGQVDRWGYQPSRDEYRRALQEADVIVSTADHEFFGISVVEAIGAGAYPVLPDRLAYPEVLEDVAQADRFFYDGTPERLAERLAELLDQVQRAGDMHIQPVELRLHIRWFEWTNRRPGMDEAITRMITSAPGPP
jgi:glycosyltransferase involved in cell wall biosynthesis